MKGSNRERNLPKEAYYADSYFTYEQLWSFVEQIYHIRQLKPINMIEVGIGNGFVSGFIRTSGIKVKTFDINPSLEPDIVASVHDIHHFVAPKEFDLISCCEVLEHLPFEDFEPTIKTFSSICDQLFLTLPAAGRSFGFGGVIHLPKYYSWLSLWLKMPNQKNQLADVHFWEINYDNSTRKTKIVKLLKNYYNKVDTGVFKINPVHYYFKCKK